MDATATKSSPRRAGGRCVGLLAAILGGFGRPDKTFEPPAGVDCGTVRYRLLAGFPAGLLGVWALVAGCRAGVSPSSAAGREQAVADLLRPYSGHAAPGVAVGVVVDGKLVLARGAGLADLETRQPITPRTRFDIASAAKQFTAAAVVILAHRGVLSLDDDVRRYLPELPPYPRTVTLRHLLQHTHGIPDYARLMAAAGLSERADYPDAQILSLIAHATPEFPAGDQFSYNDTGFYLAGLVVGRVSGESLRRFADAAIFAPLGMRDTFFRDDTSVQVERLATGYSEMPFGGFFKDISLSHLVGDGGLVTTVEDLTRWETNLAHNRLEGDPDLLQPMQVPARLVNGLEVPYGLGLGLGSWRGLRTWGHTGAWLGTRCETLCFPDRRLGVVVLSNSSATDPPALARQLADLWLGDLGPAPGPG